MSMTLATCHPERKMQARGLCKSCYDKWLKENNPVYKSNQISNTTQWARKNPEKMKIITLRRREKEKNDPTHARKRRDSDLRRIYHITIDDYENMLLKQNGGCKLCGRKPKEGKGILHVDHDHVTNKVRGLLCHQCNWFLGTIEADIGILDRIKEYLEVR